MAIAFLVFDAGTGAGRSLVIDQSGNIRGQAYREWSYSDVTGVPGGMDLDAPRFLDILLEAGTHAIKESGVAPLDIRAVTVTSQREGVVFLDRSGHVLYGGPNFDGRAWREGEWLAAKAGHQIYISSGTYPPMYGIPARLAWFLKNHPEIYEQIEAILTLGDWVAFALTGEKATEPTLASSTGIFDVRERNWSQELTKLHNIPSTWLPRIMTSQSQIGKLLPNIANRLGLANIPVVIAGGDTQCAMLGMGLTSPGETGCVAGTTSPVQRITGKPVFDQQMRTYTSCYLLPETWILESNAIVTGLALRWLKESLGAGNDYDELNARANSVPVGSRGTLAFLGAEICDMAHYKSIWTGGFLFPCPPAQIGLPEYYRSVLESNAYSVRGNLEQITEITNVPTQKLHVCGGQISSLLFTRILSNVTYLPLEIHSKQATAVGAAASAAVATGVYSRPDEAAKQMSPGSTTVDPNREISSQYEPYYQKWLETYHKLRNLTNKPQGDTYDAQ